MIYCAWCAIILWHSWCSPYKCLHQKPTHFLLPGLDGHTFLRRGTPYHWLFDEYSWVEELSIHIHFLLLYNRNIKNMTSYMYAFTVTVLIMMISFWYVLVLTHVLMSWGDEEGHLFAWSLPLFLSAVLKKRTIVVCVIVNICMLLTHRIVKNDSKYSENITVTELSHDGCFLKELDLLILTCS